MATTTTTKSTPRRTGTSKGTRRASNNGSKAKAASTGRSTKPRAASPNGSRARSSNRSKSSSNGVKAPESTKRSAAATKEVVASTLQKAKKPLIAGGALLAGIAGAAAVNATRNPRRKVLGVKLPRSNGFKLPKRTGLKVDAQKAAAAVTDAAKRTDRFGKRVSGVATSVQLVSETTEKAAKKA
jgi:hypothetical protein